MPNRPTTKRTPTENAADRLRAADLTDPDATETLAAVDTSRPLGARDGEHGHIDGPRGLQNFHDHPGGDRPHPHKGTSSLGCTAAVDEYVPPLAATDPPGVDQAADPPPAGIPGVVGAPPVATAPDGPAPIGSGSGAAGAGRPRDELGRFVPARSLPPRVELRRITPATVPASVALEHALIDADVALWKAAMHLRLERARTILATLRFEDEADQLEDALAVKAGMLVRLGSDGGGS